MCARCNGTGQIPDMQSMSNYEVPTTVLGEGNSKCVALFQNGEIGRYAIRNDCQDCVMANVRLVAWSGKVEDQKYFLPYKGFVAQLILSGPTVRIELLEDEKCNV